MNNKEHEGMASVIAALISNILVALSKLVAYLFLGSVAMMNESIHSLVDCGNQLLLLVGDKKARKLASKSHPFGEARAKYFYSTIVAMMLFFGGGVLGIMEAIKKLFEPEHAISNFALIIAVLIFGMLVESASLRVAIKEIRVLNKNHLPLLQFLKESRHSEILIIFAEDTCAVAGLVIALIGTILAHITKNPIFDALSGLIIGMMLCLAAIFLAREFYSLLVGESVSDQDLEIITSSFYRNEVKRLIDLKTIHLSATDVMVTAKIEIDSPFLTEATSVINQIESEMRKALPEYKLYSYIEIDTYTDSYE
ncbi:cation diffusion facilitator family transporter [Streptococcus uberis]|uniref:cation diffusion facilitator family transporter n=1 Tax=Streptococcus uberis TaxID=1349 RepID=UPI0012B5B5CC|nr:cation diffusion facilitator family transporter [Streptococcus uberis]MTC90236.1 cation diffusion facilitator family transporter [Streptococcus uberis]MTC96389.1 cation diffusion facilitator family transporter [Streptococcus uberis]